MNNSCRDPREGVLEYDQFMVKKFWINIDTVNYKTCDTNKCKLINKLNEYNEFNIINNTYAFTFDLLNPSDNNYIKFSGKKFVPSKLFIYKNSPINYNNEPYKNLVLGILLSDESRHQLLILIPLKASNNDTIKSKNITKILEEINSTFVDYTITSHTSINNIDLKNILPETGYFTYNVGGGTDIIAYTPGSGIDVRDTLLNSVSNMLKCFNLRTVYSKDPSSNTELPVFYSNDPALLNDIDGDDIYIDCKPVETEDPEKEYDTFLTKIIKNLPKDDINTLIKTIITYVAKFFFAGIILALIVYFPSFFKSKKKINNNNENNENNLNNKNQ